MVWKLDQGFISGLAMMEHGIARQVDKPALAHAAGDQARRARVAPLGVHERRPDLPFDVTDFIRILHHHRSLDIFSQRAGVREREAILALQPVPGKRHPPARRQPLRDGPSFPVEKAQIRDRQDRSPVLDI